MNQDEIIATLKSHYSRDLRKQLVKSLLKAERSGDRMEIDRQYKVINQIFSYVLQESGWKIGVDSKQWNTQPIKIMLEVFPKLGESQWYKEEELAVDQSIDVVMPQSLSSKN